MRRCLVLVLSLLFAATLLTVAGGSSATASPDADPRLNASQCALTGRVYLHGQGCARHRCIPGARMFKEGHDAELCELPGPQGSFFAQPIDSRRCAALGRIWLGQINSCASNPNRARRVVPDAPQCSRHGETYVNHRETEGWYDECVTSHRLSKLQRIARVQNESLNDASVDRNRFNCSYRPGWVMDGGACVKRVGPVPAADQGGMLMVGDSVSWRAENELYPLEPRWNLDLRPGRRLDELAGRLDWFRANHGDPTDVILELGTNRRRGFSQRDFRTVIASIPATTPILFLLPYREFQGDNAGPVHATKKYGRWILRLASARPLTCTSDWPKVASHHLSNLVDGEHPDTAHEAWYARYVVSAWGTCQNQLGH